MSRQLWTLIKTAPAVLGASLLAAQGVTAAPFNLEGETSPEINSASTEGLIAQAEPQLASPEEALGVLRNRPKLKLPYESNQTNRADSDAMSQVTSVSELRDVSPTEWAYEALRSLVERYGCIVGYPDRTFRGNRALSRWEFAAGLNACMNVMERLIQENVAVLQEDIDKLKKLAELFKAELAALGARIDNLEQRVSFLEDHQFSTTTKLKGEVIFSLNDSFGDFAATRRVRDVDFYGVTYRNVTDGTRERDISQTAFNDRVRLNLETSFTGKDLLRVRLQAGNFSPTYNQSGVTGTNMTRLAYDDGRDNNVDINDLFYRFPIGDNLTAWVGAKNMNLDDVFDTTNPYLESSGTGSLSRLLRYNNMVFRAPDGTGVALKYQFDDNWQLRATYLAGGDPFDPSQGQGLFNGDFSTGAQFGYSGDNFDLNVAYIHSYRTAGGDTLFGSISGDDAERPFGNDVATTAERVGLQASWDIASWLNFFGWVGYGTASAQDSIISTESAIIDGEILTRDVAVVQQGDSIDLWTWTAGLNFVDLGKEGAVLTLGGGLPPKGDVGDNSYIIQTQYKYPINDNILLTPGLYVILNPNNNDANATQWMGVIRTTFKF